MKAIRWAFMTAIWMNGNVTKWWKENPNETYHTRADLQQTFRTSDSLRQCPLSPASAPPIPGIWMSNPFDKVCRQSSAVICRHPSPDDSRRVAVTSLSHSWDPDRELLPSLPPHADGETSDVSGAAGTRCVTSVLSKTCMQSLDQRH